MFALESIESGLELIQNEEAKSEVSRILFGKKLETLVTDEALLSKASHLGIDFKKFKMSAQPEELRRPRIVR